MGKLHAKKGIKLEIANCRILLLLLVLVNSCISITAALTNMKLGGEMKLCDPTNSVMFKSVQTLGNNNKQPRAIHYI